MLKDSATKNLLGIAETHTDLRLSIFCVPERMHQEQKLRVKPRVGSQLWKMQPLGGEEATVPLMD